MTFMTTLQKSKFLSTSAVRIVTAIVLLTIFIAGGFYAYSRLTSSRTASAANETPLQPAKATKGNLVLYADGTGTVMPAEESTFGFNTSGQVSDVDVKVGDRVEAGQVLARLDDTNAKIALTQAQEAMNQLTSPAAIATATQALATAQTD